MEVIDVAQPCDMSAKTRCLPLVLQTAYQTLSHLHRWTFSMLSNDWLLKMN